MIVIQDLLNSWSMRNKKRLSRDATIWGVCWEAQYVRKRSKLLWNKHNTANLMKGIWSYNSAQRIVKAQSSPFMHVVGSLTTPSPPSFSPRHGYHWDRNIWVACHLNPLCPILTIGRVSRLSAWTPNKSDLVAAHHACYAPEVWHQSGCSGDLDRANPPRASPLPLPPVHRLQHLSFSGADGADRFRSPHPPSLNLNQVVITGAAYWCVTIVNPTGFLLILPFVCVRQLNFSPLMKRWRRAARWSNQREDC